MICYSLHFTADLLALLTEYISKVLDKRGESRSVALDISKAFDRVWHAGLLHKLSSYGIQDKFLSLIESFLSNRSMSVVVNGCHSQPCSVNAGVPQGSILGPTLFLLYKRVKFSEIHNESYFIFIWLHYRHQRYQSFRGP